MPISDFHASHVRRVRVTFCIASTDMDPRRVSELLGVYPSKTVQRGDERRNAAGHIVGTEDQAHWCLSTRGAVESKDINEHFRYLQAQLPITREVLEPVGANYQASIYVL